MRVEDLEMLQTLDGTQARTKLLTLIAQLTDGDAAALWALICSWYPSTRFVSETHIQVRKEPQ